MKNWITLVTTGLLAVFLGACSPSEEGEPNDEHAAADGVTTGMHGGRLLSEDGLTLELKIDGAAAAPELRAWITDRDQSVDPQAVQLTVELSRLGGDVDVVQFVPAGSYLAGDMIIREPHSFGVAVRLQHSGLSYEWAYESFEGRTRIESAMAQKFGLETELAGPAEIEETVKVFGQVVADPSATVDVQARFPGMIRSMSAEIGTRVEAGSVLATVESDESLKTYAVLAPAAGFVVAREGNPGEQTAARVLFQIVNPDLVWAEFRLFPGQRQKVKAGQSVDVLSAAGEVLADGVIDWIGLEAGRDQAVGVRVPVDNSGGRLVPGMYLTGEISVAIHPVGLAVRRSGLQSFRDFTVVYAQIDDVYEVRVLTLGRQDHVRVEVLDGLKAGARYVTANSYLVKADIDKDSASHDH